MIRRERGNLVSRIRGRDRQPPDLAAIGSIPSADRGGRHPFTARSVPRAENLRTVRGEFQRHRLRSVPALQPGRAPSVPNIGWRRQPGTVRRKPDPNRLVPFEIVLKIEEQLSARYLEYPGRAGGPAYRAVASDGDSGSVRRECHGERLTVATRQNLEDASRHGCIQNAHGLALCHRDFLAVRRKFQPEFLIGSIVRHGERNDFRPRPGFAYFDQSVLIVDGDLRAIWGKRGEGAAFRTGERFAAADARQFPSCDRRLRVLLAENFKTHAIGGKSCRVRAPWKLPRHLPVSHIENVDVAVTKDGKLRAVRRKDHGIDWLGRRDKTQLPPRRRVPRMNAALVSRRQDSAVGGEGAGPRHTDSGRRSTDDYQRVVRRMSQQTGAELDG